MTDVPQIENGFATVQGGAWLVRRGQPAAARGAVSTRGLKGFIVPDRRMVQEVRTEGTLWLALAKAPFLTYLPSAEKLTVVSAKVLVAPLESRTRGVWVRPIPMSFRNAFPTTELRQGWVVTATRSRLTRIVLGENDVVTVRAEAAVAWTGKPPTGFCSRLRVRDLFFPKRGAVALSLHFYGPQVVWVEGCDEL